jgi:glutamyl-tRNA reductase
MEYLLVSFSHKNTNIVERDKISFQDDQKLKTFMNRSTSYLSEVMIINTCNRVEFLGTSNDVERAVENLIHDISQYSKIEFQKLRDMAIVYKRESAIHHLFSVVSSLESIVVGETQIVGQVKDAFRFAFNNDFAGQKISRAVHYAFKCSAQVRQETAISQKKVSIASVAVSKAEELLGSFENIEAVVIGSGEMSRLIAQYLSSGGAKVILTNRTRSKAEEIKGDVGENVDVVDFSELANLINDKTLLFTATSSEDPIISKDMIRDVDFSRYWFDLAVPKDIDNCNLASINIFRIDDLQESVNQNISERRDEIIKAHRVIGQFTENFLKWVNSLSVKPLIKNIYLKAEEAVNSEVERALNKGYISEDVRESVEKIAQQSIKKLLHGMSKNLKKVSNDSSADMIIESINYLFSFKEGEKKEVRNSYKCDYAVSNSKTNLIGLNEKE